MKDISMAADRWAKGVFCFATAIWRLIWRHDYAETNGLTTVAGVKSHVIHDVAVYSNAHSVGGPQNCLNLVLQ